MHIGVNTYRMEKTFLCNRRMAFLVFPFMQPKLFTHSQAKTHYDTLQVSSKATHSEIKSSYYKLSMMYHPDKNKSELAKSKFQNISDAYEVLSDHQARKRYDRSIMIKESVQRTAPTSTYTYASVYKSKIHPMGNTRFNFDVWTKEHYGQTFHRRQTKAEQFSKEEYYRKNNEPYSELTTFFYLMIFVITYLYIIAGVHNDYDRPLKKKNSKEK